MINIGDYEIFNQSVSSLKDCSVDGSDGNKIYMTDLMDEVVSFDLVKRKYTNSNGCSEDSAHSVDTLAIKEGKETFIEFKNGKVENANIRDKMKDSLLILNAITGISIDDTRKGMSFIVVYNGEKNSSKIKIGKELKKRAADEYIAFGLEKYKGYYFREIHTYTREEFEDWWKKGN